MLLIWMISVLFLRLNITAITTIYFGLFFFWVGFFLGFVWHFFGLIFLSLSLLPSLYQTAAGPKGNAFPGV